MSSRKSSTFSEDEENDHYLYLVNNSSLPLNHKPARGRGRAIQLSKMTKEQKEEERLIRLEKNRLAAKDCRLKKKRKLSEMEERIEYLESIISTKISGKDFIGELKKKEERIEILQEVLYNQSATIQRLLENSRSV